MSNLQKYHVSKNLLSGEKIENKYIDVNGGFGTDSRYDVLIAPVTAGQTYTANNFSTTYGFYASKPTESSITYNGSRGVAVNYPLTFIVPLGCTYIGLRVEKNVSSNTMLNIGSTALPYEPYSTDVWHDLAPQQYINGTFVDSTNNPEKYSGGSWD